MKENGYINIIFVGKCGAGKSTIVHALADNAFLQDYMRTIGVDFKVREVSLDAQRAVRVRLWDLAGHERYKAITESYYLSAGIACIVNHSTEPAENQIKTIASYVNIFKTFKNPPKILVIGNDGVMVDQDQLVIRNEKNEDKPIIRLSDQALAEAGIERSQYIVISAKQLAADLSAGQETLLERKLREMLVGIVQPKQIITKPALAKPASPSLITRVCSFFRNTPAPEPAHVEEIFAAISLLTKKQALAALNSIYLHLKNGALNDKNHPYKIGWFGWGGTREGSFMNKNVVTPLVIESEISFETKATYTENGMLWLSMAAPFGPDTLLTEEELSQMEGRYVLRNLYYDVVKFTAGLTYHCFRHPTTTQFYKKLPSFIENEILKTRTFELQERKLSYGTLDRRAATVSP